MYFFQSQFFYFRALQASLPAAFCRQQSTITKGFFYLHSIPFFFLPVKNMNGKFPSGKFFKK